ncbi:MAG: DUF1285 domain-containing protein [Candidatus Endonucleobacter sp. (ex Gigantidas childressi)]|nr:DUF1285 domain-containing protein [Candidatus Endonucleobacter sp. (ex Gigantidas childressi)]
MASLNTNKPSLTGLIERVKCLPADKLPPMHLWDPPFCGDIDMRILRDGRWLYMGTPIIRPAMVRLFSTVLRKENDDCYYLVTPVEKVRIQVDDAPFLIVSWQQERGCLLFSTNVGDQVPLNQEHELTVTENTRESFPYVRVRGRLNALVHRNVFYQLVEIAEEREVGGESFLGVSSAGYFYTLGRTC